TTPPRSTTACSSSHLQSSACSPCSLPSRDASSHAKSSCATFGRATFSVTDGRSTSISRTCAASSSRTRASRNGWSRCAGPVTSSWLCERALAQEPVTLDGRMVAVVRPLVAHPVRSRRIDERVVEREERHAETVGDRVDQRVQPRNVVCRSTVAVRPGQDVGERDAQAKPTRMLDHAREVASGFLYRTALHDVVDSTLHDERRGALDRSVEASGDLVRSLAVDAVVPELEAGPMTGGPP